MNALLFRFAGLLLAAAVLPSCSGSHPKWITLTVINQGSVAVDVQAETISLWNSSTLEDADINIGAGGSTQIRFHFDNVGRLNVHVYRTPDHFEIFGDHWDRRELEDLDEQVSITVSP